MKYSTIFVVFFLLIGAIFAVPTQHYQEKTSTCAKKCLNHENNLFKEIGSTTSMNYETRSEIELENGEKTEVHVQAKVDIATISKCEHQITLRKVQITGPKEAHVMKQQLERHSAKFSQDNGRIESICFDDQEEAWTVNLKKAILSAIQVSVREQTNEKIVEKDILGYCKTKYEQISANTLKKTKFLSTCSKRNTASAMMVGDFQSNKKSTCKIQLDAEKQVLKSVVCEELNSMLPFAQSKASGHVSTTTKLTLDKIEQSLPQLNENQLIRESLVYKQQNVNKQNGQDLEEIVQAAEKLINKMRSDVEHNVQKETPEQIKKLSQYLRVLDIESLEKLTSKVMNMQSKMQNIFMDTVAQTGTQETAHIILKVVLDNQYNQKQVSDVRKSFWLSMLSNVDQVDEKILSIVLPYLKKDQLPRQSLFALTNMINELKITRENIEQDQRYQQVVEALIEKFHRQADHSEKVAILRSLRNTGIHKQVFEQILKIAEKQSQHVEIRIAAVQLLEQHVTEERFFAKLMKIYENTSNEAELRIAAFQVLVNHQEKVSELFDVLRTESNKQVGAYVVSYLKNAKTTSLPEFETLRRVASALPLETTEQRFQRNDLRQSRHIQFNQHIEKLDLGAQVEADLVFDEQKQLRNVRARFDLNKEQLQLKSVEISLRQNGLPEAAQQMIQELTKQTNMNAIVEEIKEVTSIRSKHHLNQKINRLIKLLNLNKINLNGRRIAEQVDASVHVRVGDKTVLYINLKDIQQFTETLEQKYAQREQIVDQILENLTGDKAIALMFTDKQQKLPTGHGLPLHTGHSMVVVLGLKNMNGAFYPSIATDLHFEMGFNLKHVRPAVQYHLSMHSAPGLEMNVERKNGVPVKLTVSMPEDRLELFHAKSYVKMQTVSGDVELKTATQQNVMQSKLFNSILGVEFVAKTMYPENVIEKNAINALFNGPYEFGLQLKKTDSSIKNWELVFETPLAQRAGEAKLMHFAFRTVGSRKNREVSAKIELQNERDSKIVHIDLKTPIKSAKIEVRAQYTDKQMGLKGVMNMDNQKFEIEFGAEKMRISGEEQYRPSIKLLIPGQKKIHYTGKLAFLHSGKKETVQIELKNSATNEQLIKASVIKSGKIDFQENFKLVTDLQTIWFTESSLRFISNIDKSSTGLTNQIEVIHSHAKKTPTTYKWKVALNDLSKNDNQKYNADLELNVPETDFQNVAFSFNFMKKANQEIESEFTGHWNNENGEKTRQVHILQQSKMNKASAKILSLNENLLKIEIVPLNVHYEVQGKTNWQRSQEKYNVQLYARNVKTNKQYKGEMTYQLPESRPLKMNLEAKIQIENNEFKIVHNIEEQQSQQYHGRTLIQLRKGETIQANYIYKLKENSLQIPRLNHELDAEIKISPMSWTIKHKSAVKINANQYEIAHSLKSNNVLVSDVVIALRKEGKSQMTVDNKLFAIRMEGDLRESTNQKLINLIFEGKQHALKHETSASWSSARQFKIDSKTTQNQKEIHSMNVNYLKDEKADASIVIREVGQMTLQHQPNSQKWAAVEIKSDYFAKPIRQEFEIEKLSNERYTIKSKTHHNQQVVGEINLEIGSQASFQVAAFDWQLAGKTDSEKMARLSLENLRKNLRHEVEVEYQNQVAKIEARQMINQRQAIKIVGQLSIVQESKVLFENEQMNVQFALQTFGQEKYAKFDLNNKRRNIQHKSEARFERRTFFLNLEHTQNNQNVIKHNTKLSVDDDSYTKTQTQDFEFEANYRRNSAVKVQFSHKNGLKHLTNVEIVDARNQVARIESSTMRRGEQILIINVDVDSIRKVDLKIAHDQDKEIKFKINLKDSQKEAHLKIKFEKMELNSKWNKESQKDQKITLDIEDKKNYAKYNLLAHYQRKTLLNIKIESSRNNQQKSGELKLHKSGLAFFKFNNEDMKSIAEIDFTRSPSKANFEFEHTPRSIKHQTVITFEQRQNELKIKSQTTKRTEQVFDVEFRINPTSKQIFASGHVDNKSLKLEGNVNKRFTVELKNLRSDEQFNHLTELDWNTKTLRSETTKDNEQVYKVDLKKVNKRDVQGKVQIYEHELVLKTNEKNRHLELNYNNQKKDVKSSVFYTFTRELISVKIDAEQKSKKVLEVKADLNINQRSFDAKLNAQEARSSASIQVSQDFKLRGSVNFENEPSRQMKKLHLVVDTMSSNEQQVSAKIHFKNLKIEKEIKLTNGEQLQINGHVERDGQKLVKADVKLASPLKVSGKMSFNTRDLKGQASVESWTDDEIKVEFLAKDGEDKKVIDMQSKVTKHSNKIAFNMQLDGQLVDAPIKLNGELKKEQNQLVLESLMKSDEKQIGKLNAQLRVQGWRFDVKIDGDLSVNGQKSKLIYKLNNMNEKVETLFKVTKDQTVIYGYDFTMHIKQGKFIFHLPKRNVEIRYDLQTRMNGHMLLTLEFLPNSVHQPNHVYTLRTDNQITVSTHHEIILNTKTTVQSPEMQQPIEMQSRIEMRELDNQRPFVLFVSYDASTNQKNRVSALFEILNESNVRVAHFNVTRQNQPIVDVHYKWAISSQLMHQQLIWSVLKQNSQKQTGELLAQINVNQRQAKIELNNKHKLQVNWEKNFDKNIMIQIKAQTDNLIRMTKIMTNKAEKKIEITNYENERIVSNYVASFLKVKGTLLSVELHKKQGSKLQKVAHAQLVKDSLNYAKVHLKADKSIVYEMQSSLDSMQNKAKQVVKRHVEQISAVLEQEKRNLKLKEQLDNTVRFLETFHEDSVKIAQEYFKFLQQYLPNVTKNLKQVYSAVHEHMQVQWNFNIEKKMSQIMNQIVTLVQKVDSKLIHLISEITYQTERISEQLKSNWKQLTLKFDHEVVEKLSNQFEDAIQEVIRSAEQHGEEVYEFLLENLKYVKLDKLVMNLRHVLVKAKNAVKNVRVHDNLHKIVNYQAGFQGKFDWQSEGELIAKIYYPSKWFN